ncbi:anti-sigma factor [Radiobacillus deserti]|uniref:Anti-sigma factor n=1 Tax=Radiobacillus deserti TaxID=2594883 RepID=A0A516KC92_9BACI|nr:anti-sigma factor [Radiobacillus deserti]QDP38966.1 hypothetical protein FN924_01285 [Radiobacillus deserti]
MNEEFKRKLEAYEKGELSEEEIEAFEEELDQFEEGRESIQHKGRGMNDKRQKRILRRGKWKARFQTALTAILLTALFFIVSSILTSIYYAWGTPDRRDVYRNVIDHTLTVTNPYGYIGGTSVQTKTFFRLEATRDLNKTVGSDTFQVGEINIDFLFSKMSYPAEESYGRQSSFMPAFSYPGYQSRDGVNSQWTRLEQIPEGTVVSAYVSLSELIGTKDLFERFEDRDMQLIWLAVDTGMESNSEMEGIVSTPIGFPSFPIWHEDDMILDSREEEEGFFGGVVSESYYSPNYSTDDEEIFHQQFMKTLSFLEDHEKMVSNLVFGELDLTDRITYLKENGVKHYGVVVTGPTKEILKLKKEPWIGSIEVDEVGFWNWISME